ncbi:hypothetical protein BDF19DRAFT_430058 [Syncephalis fuscata]|nr:hypothetical protein BDF19DRAFT_430058 [Syncephalis fuscata]
MVVAYEIARVVVNLSLSGWFRERCVIGHENVPYRKSVILAAPLVLGLSMPYKRRLHFWAKSSMFKNKLASSLLYELGAVPVDRKSKNNASLFAGTLKTLRENGVMAIFPEGTSYTLPHIMELRDGLSWAALEHASEMDEAGQGKYTAPIVPSGITYVRKQKWRSMVIIHFGRPIDLAVYLEQFKQDKRAAVKELTKEIDKELRKVTINAPDWDTMHASEMAYTLIVPDDVLIPENYVKLMQYIVAMFTDHQDRPEVQKLKQDLLQYREILTTLRLSDVDISAFVRDHIGTVSVTVSLVARAVRLLFDLPLFLPGFIFHFPIFLIARAIDRWEPYEECKAQDKVVATVAVLPILYGLLFRYVWSLSGYSLVGFLVTTALTITFIVYHSSLMDDRYDLFQSLLASWRMFKAVTTRRGEEGQKVIAAAELRQESMADLYQLVERLSDTHEGAGQLHAFREHRSVMPTNAVKGGGHGKKASKSHSRTVTPLF